MKATASRRGGTARHTSAHRSAWRLTRRRVAPTSPGARRRAASAPPSGRRRRAPRGAMRVRSSGSAAACRAASSPSHSQALASCGCASARACSALRAASAFACASAPRPSCQSAAAWAMRVRANRLCFSRMLSRSPSRRLRVASQCGSRARSCARLLGLLGVS